MKSSSLKPLILCVAGLVVLLLIYIFSFFSFETKIIIGLVGLILGLIFAGLVTQYTTEFVLQKEKFEIIDKKQDVERKKKVFEKKDIEGIFVKAFMPLSNTLPRYLFLIKIHTKNGIVKFNMNSYAEVKKMIEEWNAFGYSHYTLAPMEQLRKFLWVRPLLWSLLIMSPVFFAIVLFQS